MGERRRDRALPVARRRPRRPDGHRGSAGRRVGRTGGHVGHDRPRSL